jgi:hypothetical protein
MVSRNFIAFHEMSHTQRKVNLNAFRDETLRNKHCTRCQTAGFEALKAVVMNNSVLWNIMPCSPFKGNRVLVGILLWSFFQTEDGSDLLLRNFDWLSADYMALYPRRYGTFRKHFLTWGSSASSETEHPFVSFEISFFRSLIPVTLLQTKDQKLNWTEIAIIQASAWSAWRKQN